MPYTIDQITISLQRRPRPMRRAIYRLRAFRQTYISKHISRVCQQELLYTNVTRWSSVWLL